MPLTAIEPAARTAAPLMVISPEVEEGHRRQITRTIEQLAERAGIARTRRHILMGDVVREMSALTHRTHTDLVVMGAVSRSALARLFIGNTAERMLDRLSCDVLIVKPRGFTATVIRAPSVRKIAHRPKHVGARSSRSRREQDSSVIATRMVLPGVL